MIVITGASGKTGSKTAELLLSKKKSVRVLGRTPDHLQWLGDKGAETVTGDQAEESFLTKAFGGADAVYLLVPLRPDAERPNASTGFDKFVEDVFVPAFKNAA